MISQTFWQCQTVQGFFGQSNWQGHPLKKHLCESSKNPSQESSWQCQTVQRFFSQSNWQGLPIAESISQTNSSLSLLLPVSEFLRFVTWEGNSEIAASPSLKFNPESTVSPSQDLKLTDLSDLF